MLVGKVDFWTQPSAINKRVDIMIGPSDHSNLQEILDSSRIPFNVSIQNVGYIIEKQLAARKASFDKKPTKTKLSEFDYGKYHTLEEISDWMGQLAQEFSNVTTVINVSRSFENRTIQALKISVPSSEKKKALWFDGGIHAREW